MTGRPASEEIDAIIGQSDDWRGEKLDFVRFAGGDQLGPVGLGVVHVYSHALALAK